MRGLHIGYIKGLGFGGLSKGYIYIVHNEGVTHWVYEGGYQKGIYST